MRAHGHDPCVVVHVQAARRTTGFA
jgi:AhpD family alkylhydroperoxidase